MADAPNDATVATLENLVLGATNVTTTQADDALQIEGDRDGVLGFFDYLDSFPLMFDRIGPPAET